MRKRLLFIIIIGLPVAIWGHGVGISSVLAPDFGGGYKNETVFMDRPVSTWFPMANLGIGFSLFYDAKYIEASVGLLMVDSSSSDGLHVLSPIIDIEPKGGAYSFVSVNYGLMGKYPIGKWVFNTYPLPPARSAVTLVSVALPMSPMLVPEKLTRADEA